MDDAAAIEAWADGAADPRSEGLHVEQDALLYQGWWQVAFRVTPDVFLVRAEPAPDGSDISERVAEVMRRRSLQPIPGEHPIVLAITYTDLSLAGANWEVWARDRDAAESALAARAGAETLPRDLLEDDYATVDGLNIQLEGARRIAGLPPTVIVTVGLDRQVVYSLEAALPEARFEARELGAIAPEACGDLHPTLIIVDSSERAGGDFIMELRAAACGRFLPVAAVSTAAAPPPGADIVLDPRVPAPIWRNDLLRLLPD